MKICIEETVLEGTSVEIISAFRDANYFHDEFPTTEDYIKYEQALFVQITGQPCPLPEGSAEERARALLHNLAKIGALEVTEDA